MNKLLIFTLLAYFASLGPLRLQAQALAITNAHIIVGNGTVIDGGSIVVRAR